MPFVKYIPFGDKDPNDLFTTTKPEVQIWQELTVLRHLTGNNSIYGKLATAPLIDQAKTYFKDACGLSWKSAGLLYYYSFLNLAKAYVVTKRSITGSALKSTSIYHGLAAKPQNIKSIIDFKVEIHPPNQKGKKNIFGVFYEKLVGVKWPFKTTVTVGLSDIITYCNEISHEIFLFHGLASKDLYLQSLIRQSSNTAWFEVAIKNADIGIITGKLEHGAYNQKQFNNMHPADKQDWFTAYNRSANSLFDCSLLQMFETPMSPGPIANAAQLGGIYGKAINLFKHHIYPMPNSGEAANYWKYTPELKTNETDLYWHPILSDYIFAFVLSTILRYHPHVFDTNPKDAFLAEAWCNQSAITTLRYFLMEFTNPPLRMN